MQFDIRKPGHLLSIIFLSIIFFSGCSKNEDQTPEQIMDAEMEALRLKYDLPSISAAIVRGNEVLWQGYYGYANTSDKTVPNDQTIYGVASVSKLVTVTAVMQQVEQGLLDLDEDINTYLGFEVRNPAFPDQAITSRMLLTHRSSLAWPDGAVDTQFYQPYSNESAPPLGSWIESYLATNGAWLNIAPNSSRQYSNPGVALMGYIVEKITGTNFKEYCRRNIFSTLGMTNTDFSHDHLHAGTHALPYPFSPSKYSVPYYPATSLKTTISDFSKFMMAYTNGGIHDGNRILTNASIQQIFTIQNAGSGSGLVWYQTGLGFGHSGAFHGITSQIELNTQTKLGLMIFINKTQWLTSDTGIAYPGGEVNSLVSNFARALLAN